MPYNTSKKKDLIAERVEKQDWTTKDGTRIQSTALKHCYIGGRFSGTLYIVWERTKTTKDGKVETLRFIEVDLLKYYPEGRGMGNWGYKDMDCCMGPVGSTCPPAYLDLCPPHIHEGRPEEDQWCKHFHERCRAYWTKRREQGRKRRTLKVGDTVQLIPGCNIESVTVTSLRPLMGEACYRTYRIKASLIDWVATERIKATVS